MFPERKSTRKSFCTLSGVLISVIEFVWHVCQNASLFADEDFEKSHFFSNKKTFTELFQSLRGKLSYFGNETPADYQKCLSLVWGNFRENFVFGGIINRSIGCLRIRGEFFFSDLEENRAFGRKVSARLPKQESTLPKCFIKKAFFLWLDKCLGTFFQTFGWFFSGSCKKHQKVVKLFFYLSTATSPCENFFSQKWTIW